MQRRISTPKVKLQHAASRGRRLKLPSRGRPVEPIPGVRRHRHSDVSLRSQSVRVSSSEGANAGAWPPERVVNVGGVICAGAKI